MDSIYKYSTLNKVNLEIRNLKERLLIVETQLQFTTETMVCDLSKPLSVIDRVFEQMPCTKYWERELETVTGKINERQRVSDALTARWIVNQREQA